MIVVFFGGGNNIYIYIYIYICYFLYCWWVSPLIFYSASTQESKIISVIIRWWFCFFLNLFTCSQWKMPRLWGGQQITFISFKFYRPIDGPSRWFNCIVMKKEKCYQSDKWVIRKMFREIITINGEGEKRKKSNTHTQANIEIQDVHIVLL